MEASFPFADGHDLVGTRCLLPRNLAGHYWDKALLAAVAIHLLMIFFFLALIRDAAAPPFAPEQVVVVQLAPLEQTAELAPVKQAEPLAPVTEAPPEHPAKITPRAPDKPLPRLEKKPKPASPKPVPAARQQHSEKKTLAKPDTPAPAVEPVASAATATAQQPVAAQQGAAARSGRANVTAATGLSVLEPRPIDQPKPAYPPQAQRRGLEGKVILQVTVGVDGAVRAVTVSRGSSHSLLDEAAVAGVWHWRFQPGQVGGEKKEMSILLPVEFRLR